MMTGTAAATFPISSSVCMIFLIRACRRKGAELGRRRLRPYGGAGTRGYPGRRRGALSQEGMEGGGASGHEHLKAPAPPPAGPGPEAPGNPARRGPARPRAHRRKPRVILLLLAWHLRASLAAPGPAPPPAASGPRACSPPARRGPPGSWCRLLRFHRFPQGPSAARRSSGSQNPSAGLLEPLGRCASSSGLARHAHPLPGQKYER